MSPFKSGDTLLMRPAGGVFEVKRGGKKAYVHLENFSCRIIVGVLALLAFLQLCLLLVQRHMKNRAGWCIY